MTTDPVNPLLPLAGFGIIFLLVYLAFIAGVMALSLWLVYTIVWRAVRRGLREFYFPTTPQQGVVRPPFPDSPPAAPPTAPPPGPPQL